MYYVDDSTGGLEVSHNCLLSSKDYPGCPGAVRNILWTPDGCALVASWGQGGMAMWSTFGALLMCSLGWDYGLNVDIQKWNPLKIHSMVCLKIEIISKAVFCSLLKISVMNRCLMLSNLYL